MNYVGWGPGPSTANQNYEMMAGGLVHQGPDQNYDRSGLAQQGSNQILINYDGWGPGPPGSGSKL